MGVWKAAQDVLAEAARPSAQQMAAYARQVQDVKELLDQEDAEGRSFVDTATGALDGVEAAIGVAIDDFRKRVSRPAGSEAPATGDGAVLGREIERLKNQSVRGAFMEGAKALSQAGSWPGAARQRLHSAAVQAQASARGLAAKRGTLMVVDDDEVSREMVAAALQGSGYELVMLPDGASLIGAIRRKHPSMILMDISLPDLDGLLLTKMLKSLPGLAGVPILMLTGHATRESIARSVEAGAVGYIVKPFARDVLLRQIERFLET